MHIARLHSKLKLTHRSNNHIQDVLLVSYLANTIRTQMDLSHRLATAALTMGGEGTSQTQEGGQKGERGQQRGRGGGGAGGRREGGRGGAEQ